MIEDTSCTERDRRRMRPEDRCSTLYDAALAVFAAEGYGRATLNDIAEEAGVTKGCLYHYFESKESLLLALIRDRIVPPHEEMTFDVSAATTREEAIALLVRQLWAHFQRPGQLELTTLAFAELSKPDVSRVLFEEWVSKGRQRLRDAVAAMPREQALTEEDINAIAVVLPSLVMGAAFGYRLFRDVDPAELSADAVERTVATVLTRGV